MEDMMFSMLFAAVLLGAGAAYYATAPQAPGPAGAVACGDGTPAGFCSASKPYFCNASLDLVENASCGCPEGETMSNGSCAAPEGMRSFDYTLRGARKRITVGMNESVYAGLMNTTEKFYCINGSCPSERDRKLAYIDKPAEMAELLKIAERIRGESNDSDDRARIAISLVQNIPYDFEKAQDINDTDGRYPYEVLYEGKGICEEKSRLLVFLLRELGYGTALLKYDAEDHMAIGIKCADEYANYMDNGTGYCFVETTVPSIIGDSGGKYSGGKRISTMPTVIQVSDGLTFDAGSMEYYDALGWEHVMETADASPGKAVDGATYFSWLSMKRKYGIG
jgi:hypothetical protein